MLNIPINVCIIDSRTLVGARFVVIHLHDVLYTSDVALLVELLRSHFTATQDINLDGAVQDIREFFSSRQYVATVERTLSDFDFVLAMNMLGHMTDPHLSFRVTENKEMTDIHMWEPDALPNLEYMLC
jgi:hypothetical protein